MIAGRRVPLTTLLLCLAPGGGYLLIFFGLPRIRTSRTRQAGSSVRGTRKNSAADANDVLARRTDRKRLSNTEQRGRTDRAAATAVRQPTS